ncbi:hypothetical protein QR680_001758 [Steinernema hermaphroditum]|uniref:Aquaporin n=1 Tax=Steinernema hermaphroditum TaxID=289476 RepID=A0AA39H0K1_9BILA|nr:hypothetical protein QR680_001758 [Steinernema hermaphroditum]
MNESDNFVLDTQLDPRYGIYDSYPSDRPEQHQWNGTARSERTPMRGILRNSTTRPSCGSSDYAQTQYRSQATPRCSFADAILRACTAEFISVLITVFISQHVEASVAEYHLSFLQRIAFLSLVDATVVLVFVSAFRTVHINPVITLAQMFATTTSWIMCIFLVFMQLLASIIAVSLYNYLHAIPAHSIAAIHQNVKADWIKSTYTFVLLQFCGTMMVIMSNLMITTRHGARRIYVGFMTANPLCLYSSILIASFLSLSQASVHWNPLQSLAISIFFTIKGEESPWISHYVFWIGALGGSMFACFLYRLFFAPEDKRLTNCCCTSEPAETV